MGCPPVCGDNPLASARDYLTYRWTLMVYLFYTTYTSVDLAHHEIFRAKVDKGGINSKSSSNKVIYVKYQVS